MNTTILTLQLRTKRDLVLARQHARQIAGLLGFGPHDQMEIGAIVFEIAQAARRNSRDCSLRFQLEDDSLQVFPLGAECRSRNRVIPRSIGRNGLRLDVPLPRDRAELAQGDVLWIVEQLTRMTPVNLFEELQQQNQHFLQTLQQLQACQAEMDQLRRALNMPAAA